MLERLVVFSRSGEVGKPLKRVQEYRSNQHIVLDGAVKDGSLRVEPACWRGRALAKVRHRYDTHGTEF